LDAALLRPGRLEVKVFVASPDLADRIEIIEFALSRLTIGDSVEISQLATQTDGATAAQLVSLCRDAAFVALDQDLNGKTIEQCHFVCAASSYQLEA